MQDSIQEVTKVVSRVEKRRKITKCIFMLTLTVPWTNSADDKLIIFFLLFPENRI